MTDREQVWTVLSMLEWATDYFKKRNIANPRLSIEWLLSDVLSIRRLDLYLKYDRPLSADELDTLRPMIKRRGLHEPLQYITGYTEFMDCRIEVGPGVLIPRPETEQLVEFILDETRQYINKPLSMLDIGTGSGCIPVAIKKSRMKWACTGIDNSETSLQTAKRNSLINGAEVEFLSADLRTLNSVPAFRDNTFDLIISNPPYILPGEKETLDPEVSDYEPAEALFHSDPVMLYDLIGEFSFQHLTDSGALYLECNNQLTGKIKETLEKYFDAVDILPDYDKRERFIKASDKRTSL